MSQWWSYQPADFLLFSPRVYERLVEMHNAALWPLHILAAVLGAVLLVATLRSGQLASRIVGAVLGVAWLWIAWSFLWERYATINWAAAYVAPLFVLEGLLLVAFALRRDALAPMGARWAHSAAVGLLAFAVLLYPLLAPMAGRPWQAAELFGLFPDPTALATLAVLSMAGRGAAWLMIIPVAWCALASETASLLGFADFFVPAAGAALAVVLRLARRLGEERR